MDGQPDRARRREFIRTHHPDRGGDPATFMTGLAAFDRRPTDPAIRVEVVRHRPWPSRVLQAAVARARRRREPRVR